THCCPVNIPPSTIREQGEKALKVLGKQDRDPPLFTATDEKPLKDFFNSCEMAVTPIWKERCAGGMLAATNPQESAGDKARVSATEAEPAWIAAIEDVLAARAILYISHYFVQMRTLILSMAIPAVLALFAITSYIFIPERLLLYPLLAFIGAVVVSIGWVFVQLNR